jgi:nicotinamidase-related amidase
MSKDFVFHIDLESILRAKGITHLVMAGISTSGVVLSTLRWAADFDYEITGSLL